jgi:hypothetical protein
MLLAACESPEQCAKIAEAIELETAAPSARESPIYVGETVALRLNMKYSAACKVSSTTVEVLDPSGAPFPANVTAAGPRPEDQGRVEFTPQSAGWYRVRVHTGEPINDVDTKHLYAVHDATPKAYTELPYHCEDLKRTTSGTWLCDGRVLRDGETVQTFPANSMLSVAGNTVWEYNWNWPNQVGWLRRYEDRGQGQLVQWPPNTLSVPYAGAKHLLPSERELLALFSIGPDGRFSRSLLRFEVGGDVLVETAGVKPRYGEIYFADSSGHLTRGEYDGQLWREGDRVLALFSRSGSTYVCPYTLSPGAITFDPEPSGPWRGECQSLSGGHFSGFLAQGVLVTESSTIQTDVLRKLSLYTRVDRHLEATVTAEIPVTFYAPYVQRDSDQVRPVFYEVLSGTDTRRTGVNWLLPRLEEGRLILEEYNREPGGFEFAAAHSGFAWEKSTGTANFRTRVHEP